VVGIEPAWIIHPKDFEEMDHMSRSTGMHAHLSKFSSMSYAICSTELPSFGLIWPHEASSNLSQVVEQNALLAALFDGTPWKSDLSLPAVERFRGGLHADSEPKPIKFLPILYSSIWCFPHKRPVSIGFLCVYALTIKVLRLTTNIKVSFFS
jgi:hypothetical protein